MTLEIRSAFRLFTDATLQLHLRTVYFQVACYVCQVFELETVATFQWAVELFAKALQQVLTRFIVGVGQSALLALELVSVKSVEHEAVEAFRGLEEAFAVGAVAVVL